MVEKIYYLCDGEREDCSKKHCYKTIGNVGSCTHTTNINHAKNFRKHEGAGLTSFHEKEATSEELVERKIKIILEGEKEYIAKLHEMKNATAELRKEIEQLNVVLEKKLELLRNLC